MCLMIAKYDRVFESFRRVFEFSIDCLSELLTSKKTNLGVVRKIMVSEKLPTAIIS